jgi:outer membrane protein OmpA-like peptidoglycan-associated protein
MAPIRRTSAAAIIAGTLLWVALQARGQERPAPSIYLGPIAGLGLGLETSDVPVYAGSRDCGVFATGRSLVPSLGAELLLPGLFGEGIGISLRGGVSLSSGHLTALPVDPVRVTDHGTLTETGSPTVIELDREFRLFSTIWSTRADLLVRYALGPHFSVAGGPTIGYRFAATFRETDNVLGPGDYRFPDGQSEHPMPFGPTLVRSPLSFGPMIALGYGSPIRSTKLFAPEIFARYDLLSPVHDAIWRRFEAGASAALLFDITPAPEPVPPAIPPPVEPPVAVAPAPPRLSASIEIYGVDESGSRAIVPHVQVQEVLYRQHAPLLRAIFFDRDSGELAGRYARLRTADADSFRIDDLTGSTVLQVQHQTLNIIGSRLRENPSLRISLVGSVSSDETPSLAAERARSVREYLRGVWGIDPARVKIAAGPGTIQRSHEATEDGRADNRRVEFSGSGPQLTMPVVTEEVVRDFNPPIIQMDPHFVAEAGVKEWTISISQDGKELAHYTNHDRESGREPDLTWNLVHNRIDSALAPLDAVLTVVDSTGASVVARTQVPLLLEMQKRIIDKRIELHGDRERIAYSLVAFDYNSAELNDANGSEIRSIAAAVKSGATLTVTGYTDRIGDERRNASLSSERAARVAAAIRERLETLGLHDVNVLASGAGIETTRFENDLPEGRVLSRGVTVVIDQGVEGE